MTTVIISFLAGANYNLSQFRDNKKAYVAQWAIVSILIGIAWSLFAWAFQPSFAYPFWGAGVWFVLIGWFLNAVVATLKKGAAIQWLMTWALLATVIIRGITGADIFHAGELTSFIGGIELKPAATTLAATDNHHIRMVPSELATWKADKVLGEAGTIGSRVHVGALTIQMVDKRLKWVAPLEFNAFQHWQSAGVTPGYVVVDAEDANAPAHLVTKLGDTDLKLRYLSSACFGDNLERYVWSAAGGKYQHFVPKGWHFELDDTGKPFWIVTLCKPTIQWSGLKAESVLLVDAQSGDITETTVKEVPGWVDRVIPADLALSYLNWHGEYQEGWWNAFWTKDDVFKATGDDLEVVYGVDGRCHYFSGLTSVSEKDAALLGIALIDSRSGKAERYPATGAHEDASVSAVNAAVKNYAGYHGSEAIPYLLYGELAFVVPVLSDNHLFQRLAIVRASNSQVVLGTDKQSALHEYQRMLATSGGNSTSPDSLVKSQRASFTLERITADVQNGTTVWLLWSSKQGKIFSATSKVNEEIPNLRPGDTVTVEFLDGNSKVIPISAISIEWSK
jgi:hypothetical protein